MVPRAATRCTDVRNAPGRLGDAGAAQRPLLDEHNDFLLKQRPVPQVQGNNRREK